jgi:pimeloyl-ACP methyl ester carboxylesterase
VELPETRYALSGDVSIAYQVHGGGPVDLVVVPGWISNVELTWEDESAAAHYRRLGEFARVIRFDKRGTGLSDRAAGIADMETRMDDIRAVLDAVGSERGAIMGASEGGPLAALFAATYPERAVGLVLYGAAPRFTRGPGFPWGPTREQYLAEIDDASRRWGTREWLPRCSPTLGRTQVTRLPTSSQDGCG